MATASTTSGSISSLVDLRYQEVEQVRPLSLPVEVSPLSVGDVKLTARAGVEAGWLECNGQSVSTTLYPALFAAIGYVFGGSGNNFNVPDLRGRVPIGAGQGTGLTNRARGTAGGVERHTLSLTEMPSHGHGITDPGHSHVFSDPGHSHGVFDPGHIHLVSDPGHEHSLLYKRSTTTSENISVGGAELSQAIGDRPIPNTSRNTTNIGIVTAQTGVSLAISGTGCSIATNGTGISVFANGGNGSHENMQPFLTLRYVIKAQ